MISIVFPLVPIEGIHIVSGKPTVGTHERFSCVS